MAPDPPPGVARGPCRFGTGAAPLAPVTPSTEPVRATAGSTWTWTLSSADYPISEGWTPSYAIKGASDLVWSSGWVTNNGSFHTVVIPASSTAVLTEGRYEFTRIWTGSGTYSGYRYTDILDPLVVVPNPATATAGDRVSFAETNLAAVQAAITARLAGDEPEEYAIGGRSVRKMTIDQLQRLRAALQTEVWRERNPTAANPKSYVRFTAAT